MFCRFGTVRDIVCTDPLLLDFAAFEFRKIDLETERPEQRREDEDNEDVEEDEDKGEELLERSRFHNDLRARLRTLANYLVCFREYTKDPGLGLEDLFNLEKMKVAKAVIEKFSNNYKLVSKIKKLEAALSNYEI